MSGQGEPEAKLSTAQKRALLDRNISSRTVSRKAEQAINDEKEHKVYRNWCNWILKGAGIDIVMNDFCVDMSDGVVLNRMVEAFSGRQQRYTKVCANEFQKIDNINLALAWFKRKGLITTVASQDFVSGNIRPILGFVWMLIQKYQLVSNQSMSFTPEEEGGSIYDWVAKYVKDYPGCADLKLTSPQDFRDGNILSYMVHKNVPESIPLNNLDREMPQAKLERAIGEAYNKLGVPLLMEAKDLLEVNPHEPTLLTYLFAFKATVENEKHLAKRREDMEQAEKERTALLGRAAQADELAQQAAREKEALERERKRLQEEESRRQAEEEERARLEREREAELAKLRKEKFDLLQQQRQADADRKAREEEAERLRRELEEAQRQQAERDRALREANEAEERRRLEGERALKAQQESAEEALRRKLAEMERERDEARRAKEESERQQREMARLQKELEEQRRKAAADADELRYEMEEERRKRDKAALDADKMRNEISLLKQQQQMATPAEQGLDCAGCGQKLRGQVVRVNGTTLYHEKCFACRTCAAVFDQFYYPHHGTPYCQRHYLEAANVRCGKCTQIVSDEKCVVARQVKYHSRCFVCSDASCGRPFEEAFYMRNNLPYCDRHAKAQ